VIQDQAFERVGGLRTIKVDVRLIAATNRNLLQDVKDGIFREDLYYRLNVFHAHVPPLRERKEDILPLTDYFIQKFNRKLDRAVKDIASSVKQMFIQYGWPGNIRELENLTERMVLMTGGDTITFEDVPEEFKLAVAAQPVSQQDRTKIPFKDVIKSHMEDVEKQAIIQCLEECGGNVTKAAQRLGLSRKGLQLKMIKYNLRK
jgi:transcriptional regulator with PAS, ATPase and Fis domain